MIGQPPKGLLQRSMSNKSYQQYKEGTYPAARVLLCSLLPENPQPSVAKGNQGLPGYHELGRLGLLHTTSRCLLLCPIHFSQEFLFFFIYSERPAKCGHECRLSGSRAPIFLALQQITRALL